MGSCTVGGDPQHHRVEFLEFAIQVTESLGFFSSPGGVVFRVEIDDQIFSLKVLQGDVVSIFIGQGESRRRFAFLNWHCNLLIG